MYVKPGKSVWKGFKVCDKPHSSVGRHSESKKASSPSASDVVFPFSTALFWSIHTGCPPKKYRLIGCRSMELDQVVQRGWRLINIDYST